MIRIGLILVVCASAVAVAVLLGADASGGGLQLPVTVFFAGLLGFLILAPARTKPLVFAVAVLAGVGVVALAGFAPAASGEAPNAISSLTIQATVAVGVLAGVIARVRFRFIALLFSTALAILYVRYHDLQLLAVAALLVGCALVVLYSHVLMRPPSHDKPTARDRPRSGCQPDGSGDGSSYPPEQTPATRGADTSEGGLRVAQDQPGSISRESENRPDSEEQGGLTSELGVEASVQQLLRSNFWRLLLLFQTVSIIVATALTIIEFWRNLVSAILQIVLVAACLIVWASSIVATQRWLVQSNKTIPFREI